MCRHPRAQGVAGRTGGAHAAGRPGRRVVRTCRARSAREERDAERNRSPAGDRRASAGPPPAPRRSVRRRSGAGTSPLARRSWDVDRAAPVRRGPSGGCTGRTARSRSLPYCASAAGSSTTVGVARPRRFRLLSSPSGGGRARRNRRPADACERWAGAAGRPRVLPGRTHGRRRTPPSLGVGLVPPHEGAHRCDPLHSTRPPEPEGASERNGRAGRPATAGELSKSSIDGTGPHPKGILGAADVLEQNATLLRLTLQVDRSGRGRAGRNDDADAGHLDRRPYGHRRGGRPAGTPLRGRPVRSGRSGGPGTAARKLISALFRQSEGGGVANPAPRILVQTIDPPLGVSLASAASQHPLRVAAPTPRASPSWDVPAYRFGQFGFPSTARPQERHARIGPAAPPLGARGSRAADGVSRGSCSLRGAGAPLVPGPVRAGGPRVHHSSGAPALRASLGGGPRGRAGRAVRPARGIAQSVPLRGRAPVRRRTAGPCAARQPRSARLPGVRCRRVRGRVHQSTVRPGGGSVAARRALPHRAARTHARTGSSPMSYRPRQPAPRPTRRACARSWLLYCRRTSSPPRGWCWTACR